MSSSGSTTYSYLDGALMLCIHTELLRESCCWEKHTHEPQKSTHTHGSDRPMPAPSAAAWERRGMILFLWQNKHVHLNAAHRYLQPNARQRGNKLQSKYKAFSIFLLSSLRSLKHSQKINQSDLFESELTEEQWQH